MKRILLLLCGILCLPLLQAQEKQTDTAIRSPRFHLGLNYTYIRTDIKLTYMTKEYSWNNTDFGVNELSKGQIDTLNSLYKYSRDINCMAFEFGWVMLDKPGGKWFIDGKVIFGLSGTNYKTTNVVSGETALKFNSGFAMNSVGFAFMFRYNFTPHWGLSLAPALTYVFGTEKNVEDNTFGTIEYFSETRQNTFKYLYARTALMATYTVKGFSVSAGPGIYLLYNTNKYTIDRTSPDSKNVYHTVIQNRLISKSMFDAELAVEWKVIKLLSISVYAALGNDLIIHPALHFNL